MSSTRDMILEWAARMFGERGYAATSVRDIADAVGIKSASLYYHYPSKDEIYLAVSKRGIDEVFDAVRAAQDALPCDASARERLRAAIRAHMTAALASGPFTAVNIRCSMQIPEEVRRRSAEQRRHYERYWRDLIRAGIEEGAINSDADATMLSLYIFGFMNWTAEWFVSSHWSVDEVAARYSDFLFQGVAPQQDE